MFATYALDPSCSVTTTTFSPRSVVCSTLGSRDSRRGFGQIGPETVKGESFKVKIPLIRRG